MFHWRVAQSTAKSHVEPFHTNARKNNTRLIVRQEDIDEIHDHEPDLCLH